MEGQDSAEDKVDVPKEGQTKITVISPSKAAAGGNVIQAQRPLSTRTSQVRPGAATERAANQPERRLTNARAPQRRPATRTVPGRDDPGEPGSLVRFIKDRRTVEFVLFTYLMVGSYIYSPMLTAGVVLGYITRLFSK